MLPLHVILLIDASASMRPIQPRVIKGINALIRALQFRKTGNVYFTLMFFNQITKLVYTIQPIEQVEPINRQHYDPYGITAFYDATGRIIDYIINKNLEMNHVMFIFTDGIDNMSRFETYETITQKMESLSKFNWKFVNCSTDLDQLSLEHIPNISFKPDEVDELLEQLTKIKIDNDTSVDDLIGCLEQTHI